MLLNLPTNHLYILVPAHLSFYLLPYLHQLSTVEFKSAIWDKFTLYLVQIKYHNEFVLKLETTPFNGAIWVEYSELHLHTKSTLFNTQISLFWCKNALFGWVQNRVQDFYQGPDGFNEKI